MQRRALFLAVVGATALAVVLAARSCSSTGAGPSVAATAASSSLRHPSPRRQVAPATSAAEPPASEGGAASRVLFFSPWGSGRTELGRERPREGNPAGPMSLAHDGQGRLFVLDQVNRRLVRRGPGGAVESVSEIKLAAPQDVTVAGDGSIAVLDRLGDKAVALYDRNGALRGQLPLPGEGVPETGLITGVFTDGDDVYVEREHGPLVKIGALDGTPAVPRTEIPGRPGRDGLSFLSAGITDAAAGRAWVSSIERSTGQHRFTRELRLRAEIHAVVLLDADKSGTIYFAAELHEDPATEWVLLQCLAPLDGALLGSALLPANILPEETFRDLTVLDDGGVVHALRSADGVTYQRYDCSR